jgi:hypothetical protein
MISDSNQEVFEKYHVAPNLKLSILWICLVLLFMHGDFFSFFIPSLMRSLGATQVTSTYKAQAWIHAVKTIPIVMIFLSLVLAPRFNRFANLLFGLLNFFVICIALIVTYDRWHIYHWFMGIIELATGAAICLYAYTWPSDSMV